MNPSLNLHPRLRAVISSDLIDFASNDYLDLSTHPDLNTLTHTLSPYGSAASVFVSGYQEMHQRLENTAAHALGFEKAILFANGYMANIGVLQTLAHLKHVVYLDKESHASMIDGVKAARAHFHRFKHGDYADLAEKLKQQTNASCIISESVFSMSGDVADLAQLIALKKQYNTLLMIDDAHAFGVLHTLPSQEIDIVVIPCGKALGAYGALVLGKKHLLDAIEQHARSLMYSTALPAVCAAAILNNFKKIMSDSNVMQKLHENRHYFHKKIQAQALSIQPSPSAIYVWPVISIAQGLKIKDRAAQQGLYLYLMTPPTVDQPMFRITLSAKHTTEHIDTLAEFIHEYA